MNLVSDGYSFCALLNSSGVDCWGNGGHGELGNGSFNYTDTPEAVEGVGGTGTLNGVTSLVGNPWGSESYCAVLTSGEVDCWGYGAWGELGNGKFYTAGNEGSDTPVVVEGIGGTGTLTGVTSLGSDGDSYCAVLTSRKVDCWGAGPVGELGDNKFYTTGNEGSASPVAVG